MVTAAPYRYVMESCGCATISLSPHDDARLWRGHFIEEFSLAEATVSQALAFLASVASDGARSLLPHTTSQKFKALAQVTSISGALVNHGAGVRSVLPEFSKLLQIRAYLCHGASTLTVDNTGRWHMSLFLFSFRSGRAELTKQQLGQFEAADLLHQLRSARIRLDGQLRGLLASFRGGQTPIRSL